MIDQDIKSKIEFELVKCMAEGRKKPTLREMRALVGGGSFTTISSVMKDWQIKRLTTPLQFPNELTQQERDTICKAVWDVASVRLAQVVQRKEEQLEQRAAIKEQAGEEMEKEAAIALAENESLKDACDALKKQLEESSLREANLKSQLMAATAQAAAQEQKLHAAEERISELIEARARAEGALAILKQDMVKPTG